MTDCIKIDLGYGEKITRYIMSRRELECDKGEEERMGFLFLFIHFYL